jgi:hypothetical protein
MSLDGPGARPEFPRSSEIVVCVISNFLASDFPTEEKLPLRLWWFLHAHSAAALTSLSFFDFFFAWERPFSHGTKRKLPAILGGWQWDDGKECC